MNTTNTLEKPTLKHVDVPEKSNTLLKLAERYKKFDRIFKSVTLTTALVVLLIVLSVFVVLIKESSLAISTFGFFDFITSMDWDPYRDLYGAAHVLFGTLFVTILSLILAIPTSIGISIFITRVLPAKFQRAFSTAIELLAAIPSIIYGMWGLFILAPIMADHIEPFLQETFGEVPGLSILFEGAPIGIDILTASVILSIMIIPFIASITKEAFDQIPIMLKESAFALSATKWEAIKDVMIPFIKKSILGGIILAFGRALGETMAVAFVLGNNHDISFSLLNATATITVTLANEFNEAHTDLYLSSLNYLALLLFVLSFGLLSLAKYFTNRKKA